MLTLREYHDIQDARALHHSKHRDEVEYHSIYEYPKEIQEYVFDLRDRWDMLSKPAMDQPQVRMQHPLIAPLKNAPKGSVDNFRYLVIRHLYHYLQEMGVSPLSIATCDRESLQHFSMELGLVRSLRVALERESNTYNLGVRRQK